MILHHLSRLMLLKLGSTVKHPSNSENQSGMSTRFLPRVEAICASGVILRGAVGISGLMASPMRV